MAIADEVLTTLHQNMFLFFYSIKTKINNRTVSSHLYLATASANDSGTYSCDVANMAQAKLSLHILNGKQGYVELMLQMAIVRF